MWYDYNINSDQSQPLARPQRSSHGFWIYTITIRVQIYRTMWKLKRAAYLHIMSDMCSEFRKEFSETKNIHTKQFDNVLITLFWWTKIAHKKN